MAGVEIYTERIDDVPLLVQQQYRMGLPEVVDEVVRPHGNRNGLSVGLTTSFWLTYILSQADHRLSEVESWAAGLQETLSALASEPVRVKDFTDDRLADILRLFSNDETWEAIEERVGQRLMRVYDLKPGPVRLDSTSVAVYHDPEGSVLFQHGHSKDHRPDLAQFKVMLATLDPLGMPLATLPVAGSKADDGLYIPAIARARGVMGQGGRLYIGDAKMGALATRAFVQDGGDYYLMPLAQTGEVPELLARLLAPVWGKRQLLAQVWAPPEMEGDDGEQEEGTARGGLLALGYETSRPQEGLVEGRRVSWQEQILVVYSLSLGQQLRRNLSERLCRCTQALLELTPPRGRGQRQWEKQEELATAARALLKKHRVEGLLKVTYEDEVEQRHVRRYGSRPARTEERVRYMVRVKRDEVAIGAAKRLLGWRLYVSNAPGETLGLSQAVWAYRGAPRIERNFHRLKGRSLGIRPLYLQREDHTRGLVRLLSLALRVLTMVEHVVREGLKAVGDRLSGLYAGNPKRETARPTTERLLKSFEGITLTIMRLPERTIRHITPLSRLQRGILALLGLPTSIYEDEIEADAPIPP